MNKTYFAKADEIKRKCYLIDANDKVLGRVATKAAIVLRGKHKAIFTPNVDTGDAVIIINADKIRVTGKKVIQKEYQHYSGYPGGQKCLTFEQLFEKDPEQVVRLAVTRMLPAGALGAKIKSKLRVYAGDKHPHQAQAPVPLEI